jgi:hypothetical protein
MRKHTATARPANFNFAKAYFEIRRLRAEIQRVENSSKRYPGQPTADGKISKDDHRVQSGSQN